MIPQMPSGAKGRDTGIKPALRVATLVVATVAIAALAGVVWLRSHPSRSADGQETLGNAVTLSGSTKDVLAGLRSPVEIRFYNLLDPASVPESTRAFAGRVNQLLDEYERAGKGNIQIVRFEGKSEDSAEAASADHIRAFNIDKGDACFLGIAIATGDKKESLSQLSPEWEPALEFDLSRAIARLCAESPASVSLVSAARVDVVTAEQLVRANPQLASASLEQGTEMLRAAAMEEFKTAAGEAQERITEAGERLARARGSHSAAEESAAAQELQTVQRERAEILKSIAARLQRNLAAWDRAKATGTP